MPVGLCLRECFGGTAPATSWRGSIDLSSLISGLILLMDKSIKPGDVITVENTYGWVNKLGACYVSIITRDGIEHLIPNETMITEPVSNWTHSDANTRLRIPIGVHYSTALELATRLGEEAAQSQPRVLNDPAPRCPVKGFGDSAIDLAVQRGTLIAWVAFRQRFQPKPRRLVVWVLPGTPKGRPAEPVQAAGAPFAGKVTLEMLHGSPLGSSHHFPRTNSSSAALSSSASASSRFNLTFRRFNSRNRFASNTAMPPNFAFHR